MSDDHDVRIKDIKEHPERHQHVSFEALQRCCMIQASGIAVLDLALMEAHEGTGGSRRCDVRSGPCSCGAWH